MTEKNYQFMYDTIIQYHDSISIMILLVDFLPDGHNFCDFLFAFLHINTLLKGFYSNSFLFRADSFSEGKQNNFELSPLKAYLFHLRMVRYTQLHFFFFFWFRNMNCTSNIKIERPSLKFMCHMRIKY